MGRPTKFDRSEAVATAMDIFRKKGYWATSVSDLAAAMSMTRSSFYNSFKSRDRLFEETLTLYCADQPDKKLKEPMPFGSANEAVRVFFKNACTNLDTAPEHCGCLIMNSFVMADENMPPPEGVQHFMNEKRVEFRRAIAQAIADKTMPPVQDVDVMTESLMAFLIGLNIIGRSGFPEGHLWSIAQTYLDSIGLTESPVKPGSLH